MNFEQSITVTKDAVGAEPISAPQSVLAANVLGVHPLAGTREETTKGLLFSLLAGAGETVTIEVWALDAATAALAVANRKYYRVASNVIIRNQILSEITVGMPPGGGQVYIRQTDDTLTTTGTLKIVPIDRSIKEAGTFENTPVRSTTGLTGASGAVLVAKAVPGVLMAAYASNGNPVSPRYLLLFDKTAAPDPNDVPEVPGIPMPASGGGEIDTRGKGIWQSTGIVLAVSSDQNKYTAVAVDEYIITAWIAR